MHRPEYKTGSRNLVSFTSCCFPLGSINSKIYCSYGLFFRRPAPQPNESKQRSSAECCILFAVFSACVLLQPAAVFIIRCNGKLRLIHNWLETTDIASSFAHSSQISWLHRISFLGAYLIYTMTGIKWGFFTLLLHLKWSPTSGSNQQRLALLPMITKALSTWWRGMLTNMHLKGPLMRPHLKRYRPWPWRS